MKINDLKVALFNSMKTFLDIQWWISNEISEG